MNNIYLIVGASGAGKTLLTETLEQEYGYKSIQSYTTRKPRYDGEKGHTFVTNEEFDKLTDMVAYTEFCGHRYCATSQQVDENDLYVIDPKGIEFFKNNYNGNKGIKIIYIESSTSTRYERMCKRHQKNGDSRLKASEKALERIENDVVEFYGFIHHIVKVDLTVKNNYNDNVNDIVDKIVEFINECEGGG